jgi:CBS domain-containing protein
MMYRPASVTVRETTAVAVDRMRAKGAAFLPVVCGEELVGVIHGGSLPAGAELIAPWIRPISVRLSPGETAQAALARIAGCAAFCTVIDEEGRLVGVTNAADLRSALRSEALTRFLD